MADNKLSWTELRRALMTRADISEKEANSFLNAFTTQLLEALKQDKQVKVNGLGTFKLQSVAARKSVDVTTGAEITIDGYTKVNFTPEAGVKELVEGRPGADSYAQKEEAKEIDPLKKLGAQAIEIVDILGELGQTPNKEKEEKTETNDTDMKKGNTKKHEKPVMKEEPVIVEKPAEVVVEKPAEVVEEKPAEVVAEKPVEVVVEPVAPKEPEASKAPEKPKKKYHFLRDTLICVVILLLLLLIGYFFLRNRFSQWLEEFAKDKPQTEQVVAAEEESIAPEIVVEEVVPEEEWTYDELLLTEELTPGSRLAWISKKYYGDKAYWPYLYEANKDKLNNPSKIAVGTPIRVPKLSPAMMDTTSARFLELKERAYNATR